MIRQSPEVPAAVELADVSKHIINTEFIFTDSSHKGSWTWQSPADYDPLLAVLVAEGDGKIRRNGTFLIKEVQLVIYGKSSEYWQSVPIRTATQIEDDLFLVDFVEAFRQYQHGRTEIQFLARQPLESKCLCLQKYMELYILA